MIDKPATLEDFRANAAWIAALWEALDPANLDLPIAVETLQNALIYSSMIMRGFRDRGS